MVFDSVSEVFVVYPQVLLDFPKDCCFSYVFGWDLVVLSFVFASFSHGFCCLSLGLVRILLFIHRFC